MTSGDDDSAELAAVAAILGDPQVPCCPECREAVHLRIQEEGVPPFDFQPGAFYQRVDLEAPMRGSSTILGDLDGDCVHCEHRFRVRDSVWLYLNKLSERSRREVEDSRPLWER